MLFLLRLFRLLFPLLFLFVLMTMFSRFLGPFLRGGGSWQQGPRNGDRGQNGQSRQDGGPGGPYRSSAGKPDPYEVLGCKRNDTEEEIRRHYRKLMSRYHPDRFISMELDEEFIRLASRKLQEIREAYEQIARQRGFR